MAFEVRSTADQVANLHIMPAVDFAAILAHERKKAAATRLAQKKASLSASAVATDEASRTRHVHDAERSEGAAEEGAVEITTINASSVTRVNVRRPDGTNTVDTRQPAIAAASVGNAMHVQQHHHHVREDANCRRGRPHDVAIGANQSNSSDSAQHHAIAVDSIRADSSESAHVDQAQRHGVGVTGGARDCRDTGHGVGVWAGHSSRPELVDVGGPLPRVRSVVFHGWLSCVGAEWVCSHGRSV